MRLAGGLLLAFVSAGLFATSYLGQHGALADAERLQLRRPIAALRQLVTNPQWLRGYVASWLGWGVYIGALALAPLSLVQAVNAGVIGPLALLSSRASRPRKAIERRERRGALLAIAGLVVVLAALHQGLHRERPSLEAVVVIVVVALVLFGVIVAATPQRARGIALGVGSGLCYGVGDVATKASVLGQPVLVPVFLLCATLGFTTLQLAYQRTSLLKSAGLSSLFTNAIPIVAGIVLFGELPQGGASRWIASVGFIAVILGAAMLASDQGLEPAGTLSPSSPPGIGGPVREDDKDREQGDDHARH